MSTTGFGLANVRHLFSGAAEILDGTDDVSSALAAAGADFSVSLRPLYYGGKSKTRVPDFKALVRDDTNSYLSTVSATYRPIQNVAAFEWANDLVPEGAKFVAAGTQFGGRRIFLAAELPGTFTAAGDEHKTYLVMRNSHDRTKALQAFITNIRLACTNQLNWMSSTAATKASVRHVGDTSARMNAAKLVMQEALGVADEFKSMADRMATVELSLEEMRSFLEEAAPERTRWHDEIILNVQNTSTLADEQRRTAWGLFNAAEEYFEWQRPARTRESALTSVWDGPAAKATRNLRQLLVNR